MATLPGHAPWTSDVQDWETENGGNSAHKPNAQDLLVMKELIEEGLVTPVIDRRYPLG